MLFWIPVMIVAAMWLCFLFDGLLGGDGFNADFAGLAGGLTFVAGIVLVMSIAFIAGPDESLQWDSRQTSVTSLVAHDNGEYVKLGYSKGRPTYVVETLTGTKTLYAYSKDDGTHAVDVDTQIREYKIGTPQIEVRQHFLVAPNLWPFLIEGESETFIEVPKGSISGG